MADERVGAVSLGATVELVFTVGTWKGQPRASIRKFVATAKYTGATQSGFSLTGQVMSGILDALLRLQGEIAGAAPGTFAKIAKSGRAEMVISTVAADDGHALPSIDIREFVQSPGFSGPTKKGIRFSLHDLAEVVTLVRLQVQRLGAHETLQPTLFPDARPLWVQDAATAAQPSLQRHDSILVELLPVGPRCFPDEFTVALGEGTAVQLPPEPLTVTQQRDGTHVVRSEFGFSYPVRNDIEGRYLVYSHLRGARAVNLPAEMIVVFRSVKGYENYLRELQRSFLQAYQRRSGNRAVAEHQTKAVFRDFGLPWVERS